MGVEKAKQPPEHQIYTGMTHRGNRLYSYGKCLCGAVLADEAAIEVHRAQFIDTDEEH